MAASTSPFPDEGPKKARIEIIPLIDVVFFLLATFVLFTLSLKRIQSIPLQLPVASTSSAPAQDNDMVTIQVSDTGTCYWNRELCPASEILSRLDSYKKNNQNPKVLIAGDDRARFGPVVTVLDEVRKAGIEQVSVETRVRPTGR